MYLEYANCKSQVYEPDAHFETCVDSEATSSLNCTCVVVGDAGSALMVFVSYSIPAANPDVKAGLRLLNWVPNSRSIICYRVRQWGYRGDVLHSE